MTEWSEGSPASARAGNQTLARGLRTLLIIADSKQGLTVQQVGEMLGVHRSIAYRLLQTLADFGLAARNREGRYIPGARLATLADAYLPTLRDVAGPVMQTLADRLRSTISIFVEQGAEAVMVAVVEPTTAPHHLTFRPGMRTSLSRGASAYAILASTPAQADEPAAVTEARRLGYAYSFSEVQADAFGVAAPIPMAELGPRACLSLLTYNKDIADNAGPDLRDAAGEVGRLLRPV